VLAKGSSVGVTNERERQVERSGVLRKAMGRRVQPSALTIVSIKRLRPSERTICEEFVDAEGRPSSGSR